MYEINFEEENNTHDLTFGKDITHWFEDSKFLIPEAERTSIWASERWKSKNFFFLVKCE